MKREAAHQGAAVSKPPNRTLCNASLVTVGSYSTQSRNCRKRDSLTPECKTPPAVHGHIKKARHCLTNTQKLSTPWIQSLQLKIQTSFGKFRRRCLRNFRMHGYIGSGCTPKSQRNFATSTPTKPLVLLCSNVAGFSFLFRRCRMKRPKTRTLVLRSRDYGTMLNRVVSLIDEARRASARSVNAIMTGTYWLIGRHIIEFEQRGKIRAAYGEELIKQLADDLSERYGRGFSKRNLAQMRLFYLGWPIL